jgi:hypothetical protein
MTESNAVGQTSSAPSRSSAAPAAMPLRTTLTRPDLVHQFPWLQPGPSGDNAPRFSARTIEDYGVEGSLVILTSREVQAAWSATNYPEPSEPIIVPLEDDNE